MIRTSYLHLDTPGYQSRSHLHLMHADVRELVIDCISSYYFTCLSLFHCGEETEGDVGGDAQIEWGSDREGGDTAREREREREK